MNHDVVEMAGGGSSTQGWSERRRFVVVFFFGGDGVLVLRGCKTIKSGYIAHEKSSTRRMSRIAPPPHTHTSHARRCVAPPSLVTLRPAYAQLDALGEMDDNEEDGDEDDEEDEGEEEEGTVEAAGTAEETGVAPIDDAEIDDLAAALGAATV